MADNRVEELKRVVEMCTQNLSLLHHPSLGFLKSYLERMKAQFPSPADSPKSLAQFLEEQKKVEQDEQRRKDKAELETIVEALQELQWKHKMPQKEKQKNAEQHKQRSKVQIAESSVNDTSVMSNDPKRKAQSKDPGWRYGFWPDLNKKDLIECSLCGKHVHAGIQRFKQHLAGGYADVQMCTKTTPEIKKEMQDYMRKHARRRHVAVDADDVKVQQSSASTPVLSSGISSKRKRKRASYNVTVPQPKPEDIVSD